MNFGLLVSQLPQVRELHVDYDTEQSRPQRTSINSQRSGSARNRSFRNFQHSSGIRKGSSCAMTSAYLYNNPVLR
jgi:hypothetical protein